LENWDYGDTAIDGSAFTVDTISRYMVHDAIHHVWNMSERP
jgi:hypothetical protein